MLNIGTGGGNGTVTYTNLRIDVPGTDKQLTATSSTGLTSALSSVFTVSAGAVDRFVFDTIPNQTQNVAFNVTITAKDSVGNTVAAFDGNGNKVTLTSTGTLVFTNPSAAFTLGVLTASVTITNTGNFTIAATGTGGNSGATGTSGSFNVASANVATTLVLNSVSPNSVTYSSVGPVTFTATLTRTTGGAAVSGATVNFTVDGGAAGSSVTNGSGVATFTTYNPSALSVAGHNVQASFTAATISSVSYLGSTGGTLPLTVNQATPTATLAVTNSPQTYSGSGQSATVSITTSSVPGTLTNVLTGGAASQTNAGTYAVTADFVPTDSANYKTLTARSAGDFVIDKATPTATLAVSNSPQTYNGSGKSATVSISASSVPGAATNVLTGGAAAQTNAGTYAVTADFVPTDTNYKTLTGLSAGNFVIKQATPTATLHVTNSPKTYNGSGQAALVSVTTSSVPGTVANILTGGSATQTNANTYAVTADFVPTDTTNYETLTGLSAGNFVIGKANATVVVTPYTSATTTYDGNPHSATVASISGVNGETGSAVGTVDVSHTTHTNAGTYSTDYWFFTGTTNYNNIGNTTISDSIGKANAAVVVTPYTSATTTYDGNPHSATYTITGVNSETGATVGTVDVSHTTHTNAGTYPTDYWFFTGTTNYNDIGNTTITDSIGKANAVVVVTPYTSATTTYDGNFHTAAATSITGVNGETGTTVGSVDVSHTSHKDAGTYPSDYWSFTATANYNDIGNTTITDSIGKANAVVVVTPYTSATTTYDGNPHTATVASITGVNGETGGTVGTVNVSHTTHTNAGTYASDYWTFTGTANYNDIGNTMITDSISAVILTASIIDDPTKPYDGNTDATLISTNFSLSGLVNSENFTITQTGGTYNSKDVPAANTVSATLAAGDFTPAAGTLASNYVLPTTASGPGHITKVVLTASITGDPTRPYNGTKAATLTAANFSLNGLVGTEKFTITQTSGTYNSKDVATANTVTANLTASDFTPTAGADAGNYMLPMTASGAGHITRMTLTAAIIGNPTKPYDGNTGATLAAANFSLSGLASSENFTITQTSGTYNSKDVPAANTVSATLAAGDFTPTGGADVANYVLPSTASGAGHITAVTLTAAIIGDPTRPYNGNTAVTLTATNFSLSGLVGMESFIVTKTSGNYNSKDVVSANTVGATLVAGDFTPGLNTLASNYVLAATASGPGHITAITVTASVVGDPTKTYNGNTTATLTPANFLLAGLVGTESITVTKTAGTYNSKDVPTTNTVTVTLAVGDFIAGANTLFSNYVLPTGASGPGHITQADATVVVTPYNVVYDLASHTAKITSINGVNGETGATIGMVDVSNTTHMNPGSYTSDYWFFTATANYNNIGNTTITDTITFGNCTGSGVILQPINADGTSVFPKSGRTVPVKFTVCDAFGNPISDPNVVFGPSYPSGSLTMLSAVRGLITNVNENPDSVDVPNAAFRYSSGQWIFNMATSNLTSTTTYTYKINLSYGSITFKIGIK
jgi:hypothetical protein